VGLGSFSLNDERGGRGVKMWKLEEGQKQDTHPRYCLAKGAHLGVQIN